MDETNQTETLRDLLEGQHFAMLTTADEGGSLVSRPMTIQELTGDWVVRFVTQRDNDVAVQSDGKAVNLAIVDGADYVSLSGTGTVSSDPELKRELWNRLNEAYAGDADDPHNVVLEVAVTSAEYWKGGNTLTRVVGLAKAALTKEPPSGEHGTVPS